MLGHVVELSRPVFFIVNGCKRINLSQALIDALGNCAATGRSEASAECGCAYAPIFLFHAFTLALAGVRAGFIGIGREHHAVLHEVLRPSKDPLSASGKTLHFGFWQRNFYYGSHRRFCRQCANGKREGNSEYQGLRSCHDCPLKRYESLGKEATLPFLSEHPLS